MNSEARRAGLVLLAMAVVISVLIWAGVHNLRERKLAQQRGQSNSGSMAEMQPAGAAEGAEDEASPVAKLEGKTAPSFSLVDLNGKKVSLADYKGKPVLINFWATWCGPCKLEMPWLEEFSQKYAPQGLAILGVAADDAPKSVIASVAAKNGITYPVLLKNSTIEDQYGGVEYLPESFYVGRDGKVLLATAGLTSEEGGKDEIEADIKKLIAAGAQ